MKILINDNELDALKDNDVLLTKAVNKMQSLEERNGSYSSEVACGLSINNRDIFKDAQSSNSVTELPYAKNSCRITVGSVEVLDGFAELEQTNKEYMLRAYSGVSSIIEAIGESMLNELNLDYANGSSIDHLYNWTNVIANRNNLWTKGFIYPNIDYGKWATTTTHAHWNDLYPSIFCKYLFLRIFHSIGYAVTGEFISNDLFGKEILPMVKIPTTPQYYLDELYTYGLYTQGRFFPNTHPQNTFRIVLDAIPQNSSLQFGTASKQEFYYGNGWFDYTAFYPTRYSPFTVKLTLNVTKSAGTMRLNVYEFTPSISNAVGQTGFLVANGANVFSFDAIKKASDTHFIIAIEYNNSVTGSLNAFKWENTYKSTALVDGDLLRMVDCLPEVSQKDFLTTIINQYNLMLKVDTTKRTVDFSYFNSVEANKNSALDWSELFDFSKEPEIKYKLEEYAQNSLLKYETDENDNLLRLTPTYGQGVLFCNNVNLENTKEVFMSKFAPIVRRICLESPHTSEQAYIQLWITEENTLRTQNVKPRIAYVRYDETLTIHGTAGEYGGGTGAKDSSPSAGVYFQQLEFSRLIPLYYKIVSNMLLNTYTLKANFNLKLKDFEEVDFTKPIYLELNLLGYGAICGYFYCDSINEFSLTNRSTTEVELIRI
jgi:hypothetical protein